MADFSKVNGVEAGNILKIDGIDKSSISKYVSATTPADRDWEKSILHLL